MSLQTISMGSQMYAGNTQNSEHNASNAAPSSAGTAFAQQLYQAQTQNAGGGMDAGIQLQRLQQQLAMERLFSLYSDSPISANGSPNCWQQSLTGTSSGLGSSQLASLQSHYGVSQTSSSHAPFPATADSGSETSLGDIVARTARRYNLDPQLVDAVVRAESNYNPDAVSSAGAQGLMQLMPATAQEMGVSNPFDAEQNIAGGCRYLRQMLDRYGGDTDKALAAYNWGPGNLDRSQGGNLPQETRTYLARIKSYLQQA